MRKFALLALLALLAAALAMPSIAAAATPQGKLTGTGTFVGLRASLAITTTITDGGTTFVGLENDRSGNCTGDSGQVFFVGLSFSVFCAHYVALSRDGSGPKMRFAFPTGVGFFSIWRISDGGAQPDKAAVGTATSLAEALAWVNTGAIGSGHQFSTWDFQPVTNGDYIITP